MKINTGHLRQGIALVETMMAVAIIGLSIPSLFSAVSQGSRLIRDAQEETRAAQAAQEQLEIIRGYSWMNLIDIGQSYMVNANGNPALESLRDGTVEITITPFPSADAAEPMRAVSATVTWVNGQGSKESYTMTSLIAKKGLFK